ncbi:hypothetical protein C8Q80DRAFT_518551 [Daedaleopsis nitida]|nr:hypothetical protein C8Q80DRAFT_518551 [Daedaleopsis nitida]
MRPRTDTWSSGCSIAHVSSNDKEHELEEKMKAGERSTKNSLSRRHLSDSPTPTSSMPLHSPPDIYPLHPTDKLLKDVLSPGQDFFYHIDRYC